MSQEGYMQLGYVTNDFDRAVALVQETRGMGAFKIVRDLQIGARAGRKVVVDFALAFKDGTQYEIIRPVSGDSAFYTDALPPMGFAIRLHHTGQYYPDLARYEAARRSAHARWEMPVRFSIFDGEYAYFDARADIGHYLELYSFPREQHFEGVPCY